MVRQGETEDKTVIFAQTPAPAVKAHEPVQMRRIPIAAEAEGCLGFLLIAARIARETGRDLPAIPVKTGKSQHFRDEPDRPASKRRYLVPWQRPPPIIRQHARAHEPAAPERSQSARCCGSAMQPSATGNTALAHEAMSGSCAKETQPSPKN